MAGYKIGDIVVLKSGSPKMTVTGETYDDKITTTWFAGAKKENGQFPPEAIELFVEPAKK